MNGIVGKAIRVGRQISGYGRWVAGCKSPCELGP